MDDYQKDLEHELQHSPVADARLQRIAYKYSLKQNVQPGKSRIVKRISYLVASIFILGIVAIGLTFNTLGNVITTFKSAGIETITDSDTPIEIPKVNLGDLKPGISLYDHNYDNMDRGNHDFMGKVAVNPQYQVGANSRGDIVLFKNPKADGDDTNTNLGENSVSRIIGLPGEKIKINKGQIFIDGKLLDTFYGKAHRLGQDLEKLKILLEKGGLEDHVSENIKSNIDYIEDFTTEEIEIPTGQYYLVGDDWFRSNDSRFFGPIPSKNIIGNVLGMVITDE